MQVVVNAVTGEQQELLQIFAEMLNQVAQDGGRKRAAGTKLSWKIDKSHERALFSHLYKWKKGELHDSDSGQHPLVHMAWRALAIAWQESHSTPDATGDSEDVADSLLIKAHLDRDSYLANETQRAQNLALRKTSGWDKDYVARGGSRTVLQREGEGL